jgi:hypothetical protein
VRQGTGIALAVTGALMLWSGAAQAQGSLAPDVAFARQVALIRAHVATGDELVQKRDWGLAYRHFMFPVEEVYAAIKLDLRTYKTPPFEFALKTLARTVKARNARQYPQALQKMRASFAAADAGLKARQPDWAPFVLKVAVAMLKAVPDEYDDAVVDGRIARPISYQVARSYVREAERMIDGVAGDLTARNPDALREVRDNLAELKRTFAVLNAPQQSSRDLAQDTAAVTERVARIEAAAAKL